jgi:hypothetical protein
MCALTEYVIQNICAFIKDTVIYKYAFQTQTIALCVNN